MPADTIDKSSAAKPSSPAAAAAIGPGLAATDGSVGALTENNDTGPARNEAILTDPPTNEDDATTPAAKSFADLEAELFGPHPVRVRGRVERGSGSLYQNLTPEQRAHYDAAEKLIEMEADLDGAKAAVGMAEAALAEQENRVKAAADLVEERRREADEQKQAEADRVQKQAEFENNNAKRA